MIDHVGQLFVDLLALPFNVAQALLNLFFRQVARGRHVEEVVLFHVELFQLFLEVLVKCSGGAGTIGERLAHRCTHDVDELGGEPQGFVMLFDRSFDEVEIAIWRIADVRLDAPAEEIAILAATAARRALDDHAPDHAGFTKTLATEQCALQVVMVPTSAFTCVTACFEEVLHAVEELLVDQGCMASWVGLPLVLDETQVVRIFQHGSDFGLGNRAGCTGLGGASRQAVPVEFGDDIVNRGVAVCVQFECSAYE